MQFIVELFVRVMVKTMDTSGAETLCRSANNFVGQTETPLLVRLYIANIIRSELLAVMTGGIATIASGVMAAYVSLLKNYIPDVNKTYK
jgi:CNT family concentrative nucleoside transporter